MAGAGKIDNAAFSAGIVTIHRASSGNREDQDAMIRSVAYHHLMPVIDATFGFCDAKAACRYFSGQSRFGKVIAVHE